MMAPQDNFRRVAVATGKPSVLLCDRGVIDGSAYMSRELWLKLLETIGLVGLPPPHASIRRPGNHARCTQRL